MPLRQRHPPWQDRPPECQRLPIARMMQASEHVPCSEVVDVCDKGISELGLPVLNIDAVSVFVREICCAWLRRIVCGLAGVAHIHECLFFRIQRTA